jgi:excisionase family DNA binding protein
LKLIKTIVGWMDILAASIYCCTSKRTIEMWIKEEGLRISRIRGKRLIKRTWLDEFLEVHEETKRNDLVDKIVSEVMEDIN